VLQHQSSTPLELNWYPDIFLHMTRILIKIRSFIEIDFIMIAFG